jgi:pimeloyl-ACP methyl ester carboxylesterase
VTRSSARSIPATHNHYVRLAEACFDPLTAFNHATLAGGESWIDRLDEIAAPALIIHGTEDIVLPYGHALALHAGIAGSRLVTLDGVGHELPRGAWRTMVDELERHTGGGRFATPAGSTPNAEAP